MEITWLGHACFAVESEGWRIVLDPYLMDGYPPLHTRANAVLCSHGHSDHNHAAAVELTGGGKSPFTVEKVATFHDDKGGALRGENTVHILRAEGLTVVHCGDLGHFPTDAQLAAISGADALLIPVGGYYTIDAATAKRVADAARARVVVPMHYRHDPYGLRPVGTLDAFLKLCPAGEVTRLSGNSFTLSKDAPRGVVVPKFAAERG
ncbi:MAG: MBL fold metallo-hydrolase [Oscillospiraceae bacterium]|nr:MBL fold metallo-hydrolase [Oscillospiraceae bacterium]